MTRARAVDDVVVWILSIVLAAVFLLTGIPKLLGLNTIGLQAAAMHGFPVWMRLIAGIVEIVGAIALLIPAVSGFAAIMLAILMVPAALTQYASHEGGVYVPIIALVLLLVLAWLRKASSVTAGYREFAGKPHPILRDGIIAGLIGAAAIAVWFLIIDSIAGHPFRTPAVLGQGLLGILGPETGSDTVLTYVIVYTVFHVAAFVLVGLFAAFIVNLAKTEPSILLGFVVLFVATEIGFYGFTGLLNEASALKSLAWYQVMLGNLIAAAAMGYYFYRNHRELRDEFRRSMDWDAPLAPPERRGAPPHPNTPAANQGRA